ncbi:hypothetical protein WN55_09451 [Dufourea novaeangliae]|uniref:Uncharacterized protein n=1 Tax=Dufourea novaeangliae TaxID=178035 RepID=A0A154P9S8_DUFNO|nr:hypothetical protein WN55_09451 [Dufourea novaeangliae]
MLDKSKKKKDINAPGVLGAPGAGAGAVVERAAPVSSSDDCEYRLVSPQATGSLLATGGGMMRRNITMTMKRTMTENMVTAPGDLGALGAGAGVVVKQATPVSLSDDSGARLVDHQASGALMVTGEGGGSNTPSEAVPGSSGRTRLMTGGALMVLLRRLPGSLVRSSSYRSVDRVFETSDDEDVDSDEPTFPPVVGGRPRLRPFAAAPGPTASDQTDAAETVNADASEPSSLSDMSTASRNTAVEDDAADKDPGTVTKTSSGPATTYQQAPVTMIREQHKTFPCKAPMTMIQAQNTNLPCKAPMTMYRERQRGHTLRFTASGVT